MTSAKNEEYVQGLVSHSLLVPFLARPKPCRDSLAGSPASVEIRLDR